MATRIRLLLPAVLAALAAAALAASAAAASSEATSEPVAEEPAPTMSIEFLHRRAVLAGPRALVQVKCAGYEAGSCVGTLALRGPGGAHKVPYSLEHGERSILAVPLGSDCHSLDRHAKARAVARTLQLSGGSVQTSSVLRIR